RRLTRPCQSAGPVPHRRRQCAAITFRPSRPLALGSRLGRYCSVAAVQLERRRQSVCGTATRSHSTRPNSSGRSVLGDLVKEIIVRVKEERDSRNKAIKVEAGAEAPVNVLDSVAKREGKFLQSGRASFTNVITAD